MHTKCLEVFAISVNSGLHTSKRMLYYSHIPKRSFFFFFFLEINAV